MNVPAPTPDQLKAWREATEGATPGPWRFIGADESGGIPYNVVEATIGEGLGVREIAQVQCDFFEGEPNEFRLTEEDNANAAFIAEARQALPALLDEVEAPIDMILFCPSCGLQHIDEPELPTLVWTGGAVQEPSHDEGGWSNPPHRSHLCHGCGHIWRPCDRPTNGVLSITTKGSSDGEPVEALSARVERLEGVVIEAAIQFERYTELHRAKGTPDGDEKAAVNAAFAERLREALNPQGPTHG